MTPEESQLLAGLFERTRAAAANPRDPQAEALIADAVRAQPHAPYLLAQTVIVQEQALRAANDRLQQLEAQVREHEAAAAAGPASFLGGIGKSLFGGEPTRQPAPPPPPAAPGNASPWGSARSAPEPSYPGGAPGMPPQPGPWQQAAQGGGGSFLKGALGAAAGVAGGVLLADSIRGLFSHGAGGNPFGIGTGFGAASAPGGETIVNNYYGSDSENAQDANSLYGDSGDRDDLSSGTQDAAYDQDADDLDSGDDDYGDDGDDTTDV
jgi:hypothetical protein